MWWQSYSGSWGDWVEFTRNVNGSPVEENGVSVDRIAKPIYLGSRETINLNEMMEPGIYYNHNADKLTDSTLLNYPDYSIPASNRAFVLEVYTCSNIRMQVLRNISPSYPYTWERRYQWWEGGTGEGWKEWRRVTVREEIADKTKLTQYTSWADLGLTEGESTMEQIFNAMATQSMAVLTKASTTTQGELPSNVGILTVVKNGNYRSTFEFASNGSSGYIRRWVGGYDNNITPKFTGWKEITLGGSETGSWTPVFRGTTTAGSFTYTDTNEGYYFKVGGYVYIHGKIGVSNVAASPAGAYEVTGLPYSGTPWGTNGITVGLANGGQDESMRRITSGSVQNSVIRFRALTAGNTQQWEASSTQCPLPVGGAFELYFSGWYRTEE